MARLGRFIRAKTISDAWERGLGYIWRQGEEITDLGPELPALRELGVDILRLYPQVEGMEAIVRHFDAARTSSGAPPRIGERNGYWHGEPGMKQAG